MTITVDFLWVGIGASILLVLFGIYKFLTYKAPELPIPEDTQKLLDKIDNGEWTFEKSNFTNVYNLHSKKPEMVIIYGDGTVRIYVNQAFHTVNFGRKDLIAKKVEEKAIELENNQVIPKIKEFIGATNN